MFQLLFNPNNILGLSKVHWFDIYYHFLECHQFSLLSLLAVQPSALFHHQLSLISAIPFSVSPTRSPRPSSAICPSLTFQPLLSRHPFVFKFPAVYFLLTFWGFDAKWGRRERWKRSKGQLSHEEKWQWGKKRFWLVALWINRGKWWNWIKAKGEQWTERTKIALTSGNVFVESLYSLY